MNEFTKNQSEQLYIQLKQEIIEKCVIINNPAVSIDCVIFNRTTDSLNGVINNTSSIGLIIPQLKHIVCPVTGINISMQKGSSFLLSHTGLKYLYNTARKLYEAIKTQISPVHCVVMLAGVYATYSKWINKEIKISKQDFDKPIVAVEPWDSEKTSAIVKDNADKIVKWQGASIVAAIKEVAI